MSKRSARGNKIGGQFSPRHIEMLESPAYRALSLSAHRVISGSRSNIGHHGGNDNGKLPVTKQDFIDYGIHNDAVAPAIREAEALGFIRVTERGRGGNAEHRQPNKFRLTYAYDRNSPANHQRMTGARSRPSRRPRPSPKRPVQRRARPPIRRVAAPPEKTETGPGNQDRSRSRKPGPKAQFPVPETRTTGTVRKPGLLSISRVEGSRPPLSVAHCSDGEPA